MMTYEIDGWCLSYDPLQLPEGAADVTVPGAFPKFLVQVEGALQEQCILVKRFRYFEPIERDTDYASVRISCATDESVLACQLRDIYPSGWQVSVALPKDSLSRWQDVASASKIFFGANIQDCGD